MVIIPCMHDQLSWQAFSVEINQMASFNNTIPLYFVCLLFSNFIQVLSFSHTITDSLIALDLVRDVCVWLFRYLGVNCNLKRKTPDTNNRLTHNVKTVFMVNCYQLRLATTLVFIRQRIGRTRFKTSRG